MARTRQIASHFDKEVVAHLRSLKTASDPATRRLFSHPEQLMYRLIVAYRGHVQLRFDAIAHELGVELRTLERAFKARFGKSMHQHRTAARLREARRLLDETPPVKMSSIASTLGYRQTRDFARFFQVQGHETPSAWRHRLKKGAPEQELSS